MTLPLEITNDTDLAMTVFVEPMLEDYTLLPGQEVALECAQWLNEAKWSLIVHGNGALPVFAEGSEAEVCARVSNVGPVSAGYQRAHTRVQELKAAPGHEE
jgi:hypothetical protein